MLWGDYNPPVALPGLYICHKLWRRPFSKHSSVLSRPVHMHSTDLFLSDILLWLHPYGSGPNLGMVLCPWPCYCSFCGSQWPSTTFLTSLGWKALGQLVGHFSWPSNQHLYIVGFYLTVIVLVHLCSVVDDKHSVCYHQSMDLMIYFPQWRESLDHPSELIFVLLEPPVSQTGYIYVMLDSGRGKCRLEKTRTKGLEGLLEGQRMSGASMTTS